MEQVNTAVGVLMSLAGSVAVAPAALVRLRIMATEDGVRVRGFLARFFPGLRKNRQVELGDTVSAISSVTATASTSWTVMEPANLSTAERFEALWERTNRLYKDVQNVDARHQQASQEMRQELRAAINQSREDHQQVVHRMHEMQDEQVNLNAAAFPLIGFGIVISGLSSELATLPFWINMVGLGGAAVVSTRVIGPAVRVWYLDRRQRPAIDMGKQDGRSSEA